MPPKNPPKRKKFGIAKSRMKKKVKIEKPAAAEPDPQVVNQPTFVIRVSQDDTTKKGGVIVDIARVDDAETKVATLETATATATATSPPSDEESEAEEEENEPPVTPVATQPTTTITPATNTTQQEDVQLTKKIYFNTSAFNYRINDEGNCHPRIKNASRKALSQAMRLLVDAIKKCGQDDS